MSGVGFDDEVRDGDGAELPEMVLPAEFREMLRGAAARNYGRIVRRLEEMIDATKTHRVTCPSPKCGRKFDVDVIDSFTSNKAIDLFTTLGFGRAGTDSAQSADDRNSERIKDVSEEDLVRMHLGNADRRGWTVIDGDGNILKGSYPDALRIWKENGLTTTEGD